MNIFSTKKEVIYNELKKEILGGKYEFGEKLVISHLAKRFGTSEIPVREAINQLESDKLIEFRPHIGAIVSTITKKDIYEIFEIRIELEGLASRLAGENINDNTIDQLSEIVEESKSYLEEENYKQIEILNFKFHTTLYKLSDNQLLNSMILDLWNNTKRYPSLFSNNYDYTINSIQEHENIIKALKVKDSKLVEEIMIKHKEKAAQEVIKKLNFNE